MNVEYSVIYSRRRTISIKIDSLGGMTVRCPRGTSRVKIERFIDEKRGWIEKKISVIERRNCEIADIIELKKILIGGKKYGLIVGESNCLADNFLAVSDLSKLYAVFVKNFSADFFKLYDSISLQTGLKAKTVKFKDYKSMWGCCDAENNVIFNYKILMLPVELQRYVIVHELCHTVHHNHSEKFWSLVGKTLPSYKQSVKSIKEYSYLTRLY